MNVFGKQNGRIIWIIDFFTECDIFYVKCQKGPNGSGLFDFDSCARGEFEGKIGQMPWYQSNDGGKFCEISHSTLIKSIEIRKTHLPQAK